MRSRYIYPSADLFTEVPTVDRALDDLSRRVRRHSTLLSAEGRPVLVLGFPRSANTYLTHWLEKESAEGVTVLDGRLTHSALDVHRFAEAGAAVIIPIREPVATVASWMVRRGKPGRIDAGRRKLRAYAAWQRVAAKAMPNRNIVVITFEAATEKPELLRGTDLLHPLLAPGPRHSAEELRKSLEVDLAGQGGQGVGVDGIPSEWMISLPNAGREAALAQAREVLALPELARDLRRAHDAYDQLISRAAADMVLVST